MALMALGESTSEKSITRTDIEVRVGKLKNGKGAGKDKVTGEMIKGGGNRVVN